MKEETRCRDPENFFLVMVTDFEGCFIDSAEVEGTEEEARRQAEDLKKKKGGYWATVQPLKECLLCKQ